MNKKDQIHTSRAICMISDDNYAMYTGIALTSLKLNKGKGNSYTIYVLSDYISENNQDRLLQLRDNDFDIRIITVTGYEQYRNTMSIQHISARPTSLYKFRIPEILDYLDVVMYIDGDVLIYRDISALFDYDLEDKYAIVTPENMLSDGPPNSCKRLNIDHQYYFNSGLMLMNLKKMREDKITERLLNYRTNGINFLMDQDAFNVVIGKNVLYYPTYYFTSYYELYDKRNYIKYGETSKKAIINKTVVMHLATKIKPWVKKQKFITKQYLNYHSLSPFRDIEIKPYSYQFYNYLYDKIENTWFHNGLRRIKHILKK